MKMKPDHYNHMKSAIASIDTAKVASHKEALTHDARVKDLEKRFRWDLCHAAIPSSWICDNLYSYLDDSHVDTALRSIIRELDL